MSFLDTLDAFLATFSPTERAVARHAFLGILDGQPVACADFAAPLGLAPVDVEAALARHLARGTMVVEDGRVVAARGLSLPPTPHALALNGRRFHAFCAVDAVAIPLAVSMDAAITSRCHQCAAPIALAIAEGTVRAPADVVIWAADRDPERSLRAHT
jgi:hypothetical protein